MAGSSSGGSPDVETPAEVPAADGHKRDAETVGPVTPDSAADTDADGGAPARAAAPAGPVPVPRRRHAALIYTGLRLALLLVTLGIVWLLGARGWLWLALGFVVSGLLSLVLLSRQRDDMSVGVAGVFGRINDRIEASKRAEDVDDDVDGPVA